MHNSGRRSPARPASLLSPLLICSALILLFFSPPRASSQAAPPQAAPAYAESMQAFLQKQMERYHIPGLAIAIVRNGEIEYQQGLGIANPAGDPVTPDTPFLLASVSKSITALGVMQLVEAGKLSLDDPVQKHLPWFTMSGPGAGEITIAQLLYQTSGLTEFGGVEANLLPDSPVALEAGVRRLASEKLAFTPGSSWEYSNLNFNLLGLLIQQVSGQSYEDYLAQHIFAPLEMKNSHTSLESARAGGAASGYYPFFGFPLRFDRFMPYTRAVLPSAGLWSSVADLSHYLVAMLDGGQYGGVSVLSPAGIQALHTPGYMFHESQGYAMGWTRQAGFMPAEQLAATGSNLVNAGPLTLLFHEGDWVNYKAMALMIPELDYGVILLMNSNDHTIPSVFRFFAWDVTLVASGGEPQYFPPAEAFFERYSRWIFGLVILLLVAALLWVARLIRKARQAPTRMDAAALSSARRSALLIALTCLLAVSLQVYVVFVTMPDHSSSVMDVIRFLPDIGLQLILIVILTLALALAGIRYANQIRQRLP